MVMNDQTPLQLSPAFRFELDAMRAFTAVAETGAVNMAANRLARTPAAISMQLKKLEAALGAPLFLRTRAGMRPTPLAERLLPHARRMLEAERGAREALGQRALEGRVRVGLIEDLGGVPLSRTLGDFAATHADVVVEVVTGASETLGPLLERGELDLAVLSPGGAVPWRNDDIILHSEPLVWAGLKGSDLWQRRPLPLAVFAEGCAWRRLTLEALERAGIAYRVAYQSDHYQAQIAAVKAGLAVASLPPSKLEAGLHVIGPEEGAPEIGQARTALRLGPERSEAALVLARRIRERFHS